MKPILITICLLTAASAHALEEWVWLDTQRTNGIAASSMSVRDRDDVRDLNRAGLLIPSTLPALCHVPSRTWTIRPASIAAGKAACMAALAQSMDATNAVSDWATAMGKVQAVTGGGRNLRGAKNAGKNISTAKERQYYMATIDALVARVEILEASMRAAGLVAPAQIAGDEP